MTRGADKPGRWSPPPSVAFALAFALLGWIAGHSVAYDLVGLLPHDDHRGPHAHGYLATLEFMGSVVLVLAFGLALRAFFRHGSFGEWLREGGVAGTYKQVALATVLPAGVFVLVEHVERLAAGTGTLPPAGLLAVGVLVQFFVGLACLALVRFSFRVAEQVIRSLARRPTIRPNRRAANPSFGGTTFARPLCPMADSAAGRAPPAPTPRFLAF